MDDDGPGCLGVIAGLSILIYTVVSFVYFRRGIEDLGAGETGSLIFAILGSLILFLAVAGAGRVLRADLGCLVGLGYLLVAGALLIGHHLVVRQGNPPQWVLDPPTPVEWIWDDPPLWAEIAQGIVAVIVSYLTVMTAWGRQR